jgi:uncharacterized membrane protein YraQ (UPF0718 family)
MLPHILNTLLHLLVDAVPLFLLGSVLGAALEAWLKPEWIERWIGGGHRSVLAASLAGAVLPGCAMSTMPLASSLQRRGAAIGTLTAFIMIAPILSPHTVLLTATLVSVPMAIGRVVLSLGVSLALGGILNAMQRKGTLHAPTTTPPGGKETEKFSCGSAASGCGTPTQRVSDCEEPSGCYDQESLAMNSGCCDGGEPLSEISSWRRFLRQFWTNLRTLTPYLLGGLLVAALVSALVPPEITGRYLRTGWTAYLFAALVAIPIYVCDGGEIPLTRALLNMGVGSGPAFCFMLASVGTCIPTISMAIRIIGWKAMLFYLGAWLVLALGGGLLMGTLLS